MSEMAYNIDSKELLWVEYVDSYNKLLEDGFYRKIIQSRAFTRLKSISFLGAIDYSRTNKKGDRRYSRYEHSLGVAALALYYSKLNAVPKEQERHLVVSALVHDLGHAPLSHSMESALSQRFGVNHHTATLSILEGQAKNGKSLRAILNDFVDVDEVIKIISFESDYPHSEVFSSPINLDTIDGILRTYSYINPTITVSPFKVVKAMSFLNDEESNKIIDNFWRKKHFVYKSYIHEDKNLIADMYSKIYCEVNYRAFSQDEFFECENRKWKSKHNVLINDLKNLDNVIDSVLNEKIEVTSRQYVVNKDINVESKRDLSSRYVCKKVSETFKGLDWNYYKVKNSALL